MSYQKIFPEILEKTYNSCKNVSLSNLPLVRVLGISSDSKIISLPFVDVVNARDIPISELSQIKDKKTEIKISGSNKNMKKIEEELLQLGFKKNIAKGHIVSNLTTEDDFWSRFHKHTRNDIRKAEKSGLKIKKIDSIEELKEFYELYFKQMKIFGTPQHSFKFFKNCFEIMKSDFFALNCYRDNTLIGSIILFLDNDYAYVSFNVSDANFRNLRPNDLLYWESVKWCLKNKVKHFDIGQIDLNPEEGTRAEALLKFKKKWLGVEYKKIYFTRGFEFSQSKKDSLKKFRNVWSRLPNFVIKIIGPKICSRLG
ncbi:MAG: GNAT family N-acetyltransferase [Bacteroidales bacterium]|jgi:hypothetical protein|nr:GNAT family N-acetyltransferase [Bacteroidales bacterium]